MKRYIVVIFEVCSNRSFILTWDYENKDHNGRSYTAVNARKMDVCIFDKYMRVTPKYIKNLINHELDSRDRFSKIAYVKLRKL